jgi:CoA:oxalate CoA-transferase
MNIPLPSKQQQQRDGALKGMRVLDFSIMVAGPYCARMLADLGAEVIKIEPPEGDDMRLRAPLRQGHSPYFGQFNLGKRSMTLDLKHPAAIETIYQLVSSADVLVENFRPGVMERLGLDYPKLARLNPRLVYCSISGYGQTGPGAERAAYAPLIHAASGLDTTMMRYAGDRTRPAKGAMFIADMLGAIYGFAAIQTALLQRTKTDEGQYIDVALMDCMMNLLAYEIQEAQFPVDAARPTYGPIAASDGMIMILPITQKNFMALCSVIGKPELGTDTRFFTMPMRNRNWDELMREAESWTSNRTVQECLARLNAAGVPCTAYADPADAFSDCHLTERGVFQHVSDGGGSFMAAKLPFKMSGTLTDLQQTVPEVGRDTEDVLKNVLGWDAQKIKRLREEGVFGR